VQPGPDNVKHSAASLPDFVGATLGVDERIGNVACSDIPHARGGVLLVRLLWNHMVLLQWNNGFMGWSLHQGKHLGQPWCWNAILVAGLRRNS
jgi:hypothetical protein